MKNFLNVLKNELFSNDGLRFICGILFVLWGCCIANVIGSSYAKNFFKILAGVGLLIISILIICIFLGSDERDKVRREKECLERQKDIYCKHFGYCDLYEFLIATSNNMFLTELKPIVEIWYEYSQIMFREKDVINSIITLEKFKYNIIEKWECYNEREIEVYGFLKSNYEICIFPQINEKYVNFSFKPRYQYKYMKKIDIGDCKLTYDANPGEYEKISNFIENQNFVRLNGILCKKENSFVIRRCKIEMAGLKHYEKKMNEELYDYVQQKITDYKVNPPIKLVKTTMKEHAKLYKENLSYNEAKNFVFEKDIKNYVYTELFQIDS